MLTSVTASHMFEPAHMTNAAATTAMAHTSIASFRARFTLMPEASSFEDSHPPPTEPTSAAT